MTNNEFMAGRTVPPHHPLTAPRTRTVTLPLRHRNKREGQSTAQTAHIADSGRLAGRLVICGVACRSSGSA
jgi:hypothetical protein